MRASTDGGSAGYAIAVSCSIPLSAFLWMARGTATAGTALKNRSCRPYPRNTVTKTCALRGLEGVSVFGRTEEIDFPPVYG